MKTLLKILKWTGIVLISVVLIVVIFVYFPCNKKFEAPYPDITASKDSTIIAKGKYHVFGPGHCAICHSPTDKIMDVEQGKEVLMS